MRTEGGIEHSRKATSISGQLQQAHQIIQAGGLTRACHYKGYDNERDRTPRRSISSSLRISNCIIAKERYLGVKKEQMSYMIAR